MSVRQWIIDLLQDDPRIARNIEWAKQSGLVLAQAEAATKKYRSACSHRKGGSIGAIGVRQERISQGLLKGDSPMMSVIKHTMMNGDMWVRCIRCGEQWKPPIRSEFGPWYSIRAGREYRAAVAEYKRALAFETNNVGSDAIQCKFALNGDVYAGTQAVRKNLAAS